MEAPKEQAVNFADCYVFTPSRSSVTMLQFLDTFLPQRKPYATEYEIPQMADEPVHVITGETAMLRFLEKYTTEPYAIYWYNPEASACRGAMCVYTNDGHVIAGIFCESRFPDNTIEQEFLRRMLRFFDTDNGLILYSEPAPRTTAAFEQKLAEFKASNGIRRQ